jgi:hypothetical protein
MRPSSEADRVYVTQEEGLDTVDANRALGLPDDCREYSSVRNILNDLGIRSIRLMVRANFQPTALMLRLSWYVCRSVYCHFLLASSGPALVMIPLSDPLSSQAVFKEWEDGVVC